MNDEDHDLSSDVISTWGTRTMVAGFKHLIDLIQHGRGLIQHDQHTQYTSIHTCLHLGNPGFSDYTLPPTRRGTVTGARADTRQTRERDNVYGPGPR